MFGIKPMIWVGVIAIGLFGSAVFLAFKYHGDLVKAGIENAQLRTEVGNLKSEKILLEQLNERRIREITASYKEEQKNVEAIKAAPDDGCLDTPIPSAIADRLFPEKR